MGPKTRAEKLWANAGNPNVKMLVCGTWDADQLVMWPLVEDMKDVPVYPGAMEFIENNWAEIKAANPKAFPGPTFRLENHHLVGDKLVVEVLPSNYAHGQFLGWLGVAMVPVTSDGFVALQGPVASIAASVGGGTRVPGCTPPHANFVDHTIREIEEEFNVQVTRKQLTVLGLQELLPPVAKRHNAVVIKVNLKESAEELRAKWETADDKWEGELKLLPLTRESVLSALPPNEKYHVASRLSLLLVAESEGLL